VCTDIDEAADGKKALDMVVASMAAAHDGVGKPDAAVCCDVYVAVLMDYMMPVMDGPTATKALREAGYEGVILGVTGNVQPEEIQHFLDCGADTVMGKPLDTNRLTHLLKDAFRQAKNVFAVANEVGDLLSSFYFHICCVRWP
jgi:CheY-like chemotaxis protein